LEGVAPAVRGDSDRSRPPSAERLSAIEFVDQDVSGTRFERVDLRRSSFTGSSSTTPACAG
jgi:hypothetical protein